MSCRLGGLRVIKCNHLSTVNWECPFVDINAYESLFRKYPSFSNQSIFPISLHISLTSLDIHPGFNSCSHKHSTTANRQRHYLCSHKHSTTANRQRHYLCSHKHKVPQQIDRDTTCVVTNTVPQQIDRDTICVVTNTKYHNK